MLTAADEIAASLFRVGSVPYPLVTDEEMLTEEALRPATRFASSACVAETFLLGRVVAAAPWCVPESCGECCRRLGCVVCSPADRATHESRARLHSGFI